MCVRVRVCIFCGFAVPSLARISAMARNMQGYKEPKLPKAPAKKEKEEIWAVHFAHDM